ncbi:MAG: hypothetical protein ACFFCW_21575 [Candidatus Hodarchaeota archaeon]
MRKERKKSRKILAISIGIIIVGILAAVATLLYLHYIENSRVREALNTIKAIITSQKVEKQRTDKYYSASTIAEFESKGLDLSDTKFYTYETTATHDGKFTIKATPTDVFGATGGPITWPPPAPPNPMLYIEPMVPPQEKKAELTGSITSVKGKVWIRHEGEKELSPVMLGDSVYLRDHIQTDEESRVQILFKHESLLNLTENTAVQIVEHIYSPEENKRSVVI